MNPGDRIGDYEVLEVLGAGGMGKVYKVRHLISDRIEAMKILLPNLDSDPELAERFLREIKVQASLEHPNIASLHTAHRDGNRILMIVEYVEGRSLDSLMKQGRLTIPHAAGCIAQVLSALAYAHSRGVVHRDIKPSNMMVTPSGLVKLLDFGVAKVADNRLTKTGRTVGSLYYMSPEQIQGDARLDARADLYSVGVSLYELATGRRPFQGDSEFSIMAAHLQSNPVPPIEVDPALPRALSDVILRSIAKDPAQRFQSADAFRSALESVVRPAAGETQVEQPAAAAVAATRPGRRGLYMALGSVVTLALLVVALTQGPKWFRTQAAPGTPPVPPPQAAVQHPPAEAPPVAPPAPADPAVQPPTAAAPQPRAVVDRPSSRPVEKPARRELPAAPAPAAPVAAAPPTAAAPAVPSPPASPAPDPSREEALREYRRQLMMLATRFGSLRPTLRTMRAEQARSGLNMRQDVTASEQRAEFQMDEAERAIGSGDATGAKRALEAAERDIERLENFLGR
jgi:serine/threonine-protein kinase